MKHNIFKKLPQDFFKYEIVFLKILLVLHSVQGVWKFAAILCVEETMFIFIIKFYYKS